MRNWIVALLLACGVCAAGGCAAANTVVGPACQVIDLADTVCKEFVFPSGERIRLSPEDTRDAVKMQAAIKAGGSRGCGQAQ